MIILYGGAFNPPTKGHLNIIKVLRKTYKKAKIFLLPVGNNYKKSGLADAKDRINMLKILIGFRRFIQISHYEIDMPFNGTYQTVKHFEHLDANVYYVIGSDHIDTLDTWINFEKLIGHVHFIVVRRHMDNVDAKFLKYEKLNPKYTILDKDFKTSSTLVRNDLQANKHMIPTKIYRYIKKHKLYQNEVKHNV